MKLSRRGSQRSDGWAEMFDSNRSSDKSTFHWGEKENMLTLQLPNVQDPTSYSNHDYEIVLGIEDIKLI
jgi:hypothetical protein